MICEFLKLIDRHSFEILCAWIWFAVVDYCCFNMAALPYMPSKRPLWIIFPGGGILALIKFGRHKSK